MGKNTRYNLDDSKMKNLLNKLKDEIIADVDIKSYVFYKTSCDSKNFVLFKNPSIEHDFELPTTKEKFSLEESAFEIEGIPVYIIERERLDSIPFKFIVNDKTDETDTITEKPRTSSELYHIHRASSTRRAFPVAKLDFNLTVTIILLMALCILGTAMFFMLTDVGDLG